MKFSERLGFKPVRDQLQIDTVDNDLRNTMWSIYLEFFLKPTNTNFNKATFNRFGTFLWMDFFKNPIDTLQKYSYENSINGEWLIEYLRKYFFDKRNWHEYYDLIEFSSEFASDDYKTAMNNIFEKEKSAYRFVANQITQITSKIEVDEIEESMINADTFSSVNIHLNTALKLLADKKNPEYRNSIKESISAVEAMCKIYTKDNKASLGETLTKLEKEGSLHSALKKAFSLLYGYTSDDAGIRHALIEGDRVVDFFEAKFMLVTCSSFINYLKSKQT